MDISNVGEQQNGWYEICLFEMKEKCGIDFYKVGERSAA